jgi:endoglucanase
MPSGHDILHNMPLRSLMVGSLATLVLSVACDSPPPNIQNTQTTPTGGSSSTGNPKPNPITLTPDTVPGEVDMTPPTQQDADAYEQAKLIQHGMNVGNYLDQPGQRPNDPTKSQCMGVTPTEGQATGGGKLRGWMFEAIAQAGFDHVRISVNWNCHTHATDSNPYQIDQVWLDRIDTIVAHVLTRNMAAIVDQHFDWDYINDLPGARDQLISIWTQLADHFKDYPKQLFFEILNEPTGISDSRLGADYATIIQIVRATNPNRTIIYDGNNWAKASALTNLTPYLPSDDKNLIGTDHFYDPYCFTSRDSTWDCPTGHKVSNQAVHWPIMFPDDYAGDAGDSAIQESQAFIRNHFDSVAAISKQISRPIYLGEFGADVSRDQTSRGAYLASVTRNAERIGMGWANWSFTQTYDAWQGVTGWYPEVIEALRPDYVEPAN